jgi:sec-independent protein translocase protein TatA
MNLGTPELLILLIIVILLFGVGRISKVSGELGKSIRTFRDNLSGKDENGPDDKTGTDQDKKS